MELSRLRYMIEQIARNLEVQGHESAARATAEHIAAFWDPRMKEAIVHDDRSLLSPIAAAAVDMFAKARAHTSQTGETSPTRKRGPGEAAREKD